MTGSAVWTNASPWYVIAVGPVSAPDWAEPGVTVGSVIPAAFWSAELSDGHNSVTP